MNPRAISPCVAVLFAAVSWACGGDSPTAPNEEPVDETSIVVVTATAGPNLDPDGYEVALDSVERRPVGVNDEVVFSEVEPGSHTLELSGFAENCHPVLADPSACARLDVAAVNVADGAESTARFEVACMGIPDRVALVFSLGKGDADSGFESDIYGAAADGTGLVNLTNHPALESDPAWSPDGSRLVFGRAHADGEDLNFELYVVNADGSGLARLTDNDGFDGAPAWSPDGSKIAFQRSATAGRQGGPQEIFIMNADGSGVRNLTNSEEHEAWPSWSPDGSRIVFERKVGERGSMLYVMNADGSDQRRLSAAFADAEAFPVDREPAWSPDGRMIAFRSLRNLVEGYDIWVMNADATDLHRVVQAPGAQIHTGWTSDGRILFIDTHNRTISSVRPDGSDLRTVVSVESTVSIGWPKWRP